MFSNHILYVLSYYVLKKYFIINKKEPQESYERKVKQYDKYFNNTTTELSAVKHLFCKIFLCVLKKEKSYSGHQIPVTKLYF